MEAVCPSREQKKMFLEQEETIDYFVHKVDV